MRFTGSCGLSKTFCFSDRKLTTQPSAVIELGTRYYSRDAGGLKVSVTATTVSLSGLELGGYDNATASLLRPLPLLFLGCRPTHYISDWECGAVLARETVRMTSSGQALPFSPWKSLSEAQKEQAEVLATMLSLTPRTDAEIEAMTRLP